MAKKTGLRDTLSTAKKMESELPPKKPIDKKEIDTNLTQKKVNEMHGAKKEESRAEPKKEEEKMVELKRLTMDIPKATHKKMKIMCYQKEQTMREYIVGLIEKDLKRK